MRLAYLSGTRADFGLMRTLLKKIEKESKWQLKLMVTGMHLMDEFGYTVSEVDKQFKVARVIEAVFTKDDRESMARFVGRCLTGVTEALIKHQADVVIVLGDRGEQLAMATAAAYLNIPIVHLHGGEETTTVDNKARKTISQLTDWHLPASQGAAKRLTAMGVDKKKITVVGAPGLDEIRHLPQAGKKDLIVVLEHPDENEAQAGEQVEKTLSAAVSFGLPVKVIYPNADAGGRKMIVVIEKFVAKYPNLVKSYKSITRADYLKFLGQAKVLVGNSSSGLIESPAFRLPVVNVGPRQKGRERAKNVIDAGYDQKEIKAAVNKALKMKFKQITNPYGDGKTAQRVVKFLNQTFL